MGRGRGGVGPGAGEGVGGEAARRTEHELEVLGRSRTRADEPVGGGKPGAYEKVPRRFRERPRRGGSEGASGALETREA